MSLQHIFDAELQYQADMEPIIAAADGDGQLIGSGDGQVSGPLLAGNLQWTLFEHPGEFVCSMNPLAVIETEDGARIRVQARGYARRRSADASLARSPRHCGSTATTTPTDGWARPSASRRESSTLTRIARRTARTSRGTERRPSNGGCEHDGRCRTGSGGHPAR